MILCTNVPLFNSYDCLRRGLNVYKKALNTATRIPENTSVVSKCPGDSPYNTLSHECPERMRAVVTSSVLTVVRRNPDCPVAMDTYEHAQFERCCSVHGEDCVLGTTGCNNSVGYPTYDVQEYVCVDGKTGYKDMVLKL